ncbi:MAG: heavy metal translocating P-type ATPase, partial [Nitrospinota bacterium]
SLGYSVRDPRKLKPFEEEEKELREELRRLIFGATASGLAFGIMALNWWEVYLPHQLYILLALATVVLFGAGRHILMMAVTALRLLIFNQHVLLTFGALGAYVAGILAFFFPVPGFFGAAIFLTTFHLLSGYLSGLVRTRSSQAVRKLLSLQPLTARRVVGRREEEVPVEELSPGDLVRVRPGERVPVDGRVVEGRSSLDQSLVTGESLPVGKEPGDEVIGGSINGSGALLIEATRVGEESFLFRVARYVEEARALKPSIIILADRVLARYVPSVILIAAGSFLAWYFGAWALLGAPKGLTAVYTGLSVLIIGYPCALGMATPLALIRGAGLGAGRGILMRSGEAFQSLKDVDTVVFDKTGTITEGKPRGVELIPSPGGEAVRLLALAAGAESPSEHPLARAIVDHARQREVSFPEARDFRAHPGLGVEASLDGERVLVGSPRFLRERGISLEALSMELRRLESQGATVAAVASEGKFLGLIAIADSPKEDAPRALRALSERGIENLMVTGDNPLTAEAVAARVGIERVLSQVLPQDKALHIRRLQREGRRVAMVGDGINDAPALMQADIGVAIGAGTDIAIESADVILIKGELSGVLDAFELSLNTYAKVKQNLTLAFLFNGVGIPVAALGFLHPLMAMLAMALSTTAIIGNSFAGRLLPRARPAPGKEPLEALTLHLPTIHCGGCVETIRLALMPSGGVHEVRGDVAQKKVTVLFERGSIGEDEIRERVRAAGYAPVGPDAYGQGESRGG